jgi:two-component system CheB/CheR fusion protein
LNPPTPRLSGSNVTSSIASGKRFPTARRGTCPFRARFAKFVIVAHAEKAAPGALAGVHVLIVDDDADSLTVMQTSLEYAGALVMAAETAKAAFKTLAEFAPDVVLTDLRMPDQDGLWFARQLQRVPWLEGIPVLAVTGCDELYARRDLHDAGFVGIIRKPIGFSELVEAVAALAEVKKTAGKQRPEE